MTFMQKLEWKVTIVCRYAANRASITSSMVEINAKASHGPMFYYQYNKEIYKRLVQVGPDLVYAVDVDTLFGVMQWHNQSGKSFVFDAHEHFTEVPELVGKKFKKWIWSRIASRGIGCAAACITVSPSLVKVLEQTYHKPFLCIRNLPEYRHASSYDQATDKILIYQGVLNKGRCIKAYIEALEKLPDDVTLHIYGQGDLSEQVAIWVLHSPAKNRIILHGKVAPEVLHRTTQHAWLGLNVLEHEGESYFHSLANKAFDFIMAGIPALHSDFPNYRTLVNDFDIGTLVADSTSDSIANAILRYYNDPILRARQHEACLKAARALHWGLESEKLQTLMLELQKQYIA